MWEKKLLKLTSVRVSDGLGGALKLTSVRVSDGLVGALKLISVRVSDMLVGALKLTSIRVSDGLTVGASRDSLVHHVAATLRAKQPNPFKPVQLLYVAFRGLQTHVTHALVRVRDEMLHVLRKRFL